MKPHFARFTHQLEDLNAASLRRYVEPHTGAQGPEIDIDGSRLINFCSNDYLGLCNHPRIRAATIEGIATYGVGAGAAALLSGHSAAHHLLELRLAKLFKRERAFKGTERSLYFSSGYLANLGVIAGLTARNDQLFLDRLDHASIIDGARLSGAKFRRFPHNDLPALAKLLSKVERGNRWIMTEGVYSMDGDLAPLGALSALADQHDALLVCDDAHGFGIVGDGMGTPAHFALDAAAVPIVIVTFGKALGTCGAAVISSALVIETLIQSARTFIYDTALPPAWACATHAALDLALDDSVLREQLFSNIAQFKNGLSELDISVHSEHTPIQPIVVGDAETALKVAAMLRAQGVYVRAVRPPTVPAGTARLRICLSAAHTSKHIEQLLGALRTARQLF